MRKYFLGVDIGTYESKAALVDADGALIAAAKCGHALLSPRPGYAEHDAELTWWGDFCALCKEILKIGNIRPDDILAVSASGIAPCCLPVDKELRPLRKAILYGVDVRTAKQIEEIKDRLGEDHILEKYGNPLTSQAIGPKILWLRENEPDNYENADKFLTCSSYLVARLTGQYVIDRYTAATYVPLYDPAAGDWDYESLRDFCPAEKLPRCMWTSEVAGYIHPRAADETGLAQGTPVIVGTADASAEAVSAGVVSPGDLMLMLGSSAFMICVCPVPMQDRRIWSGPFLFPGTCALAAGMSTAGTLTRWFRDKFAKDLTEKEALGGPNTYEALMEEARAIPAGSGGLVTLPYFSGERTPINDPYARGVIFGLDLTHSRTHIYRSILESVGYGIAQHLEVFADMKLPIRRIVAVGGGTKNDLWMQCIADICQKPIQTVEVTQGASYGGALLAAYGSGHLTEIHQIAQKIRAEYTYQPNPDTAALYAGLLRIYKCLYKNNQDLMRQIQDSLAVET